MLEGSPKGLACPLLYQVKDEPPLPLLHRPLPKRNHLLADPSHPLPPLTDKLLEVSRPLSGGGVEGNPAPQVLAAPLVLLVGLPDRT